jgi:hypothetical protein
MDSPSAKIAWLRGKLTKAQKGLWYAKAAAGTKARGERSFYEGQVAILAELLEELGAHQEIPAKGK